MHDHELHTLHSVRTLTPSDSVLVCSIRFTAILEVKPVWDSDRGRRSFRGAFWLRARWRFCKVGTAATRSGYP